MTLCTPSPTQGNRRRMKYFMKPPSATDGCLSRTAYRAFSVVRWVCDDFSLGHLVWIKLIFLFQSASMTVLYPYINLHMKVGLENNHGTIDLDDTKHSPTMQYYIL